MATRASIERHRSATSVSAIPKIRGRRSRLADVPGVIAAERAAEQAVPTGPAAATGPAVAAEQAPGTTAAE